MKNVINAKENKKIEAYFNTKGFKKLWNYFLAVFENDKFNEQILLLRKSYKIPRNGFRNIAKKHSWDSDYGWKFNLDISDEIEKITKNFNLFFPLSCEIIYYYLFFNKKNIPENSTPDTLCYISDIIKEKRNPYETIINNKDKAYPVAIRISAYASRRDIEDFINKIYKSDIQPLQEKYKNRDAKIGKIKSRNRDIQKRNDFIYKNKNLPRTKIKEMVREKFGVKLNYEYIGKIISDEKARKRKKL